MNVAAKMAPLVLTILALGAHTVNAWDSSAVARTSAASRMQMRFHQRELEHQKSIAAIKSHMTVNSALEVLRANKTKTTSSPDFVAFLEEALQTHRGKAGGAKKTSSAMHLRAGSGKQVPTGYAGVDKAKAMLNQMIEELGLKYDMELQKCCQYDEIQTRLIEEARQDISTFNAVAAESRKEVLEAETLIQTCETKLPELHDTLELQAKECKDSEAEMRGQLKLVSGDLTVMDTILGMTQCDKSLFLMRCEDSCTGQSLVTFGHDKLHTAVQSLQSAAARQLMNDSLVEAFNASGEQKERLFDPNDHMDHTIAVTTYAPHELPDMTVTRTGPCKERKVADKRSGKCSMSTNPNCAKLRERFAYIAAGIEDKRDELQDQMSKLTRDCEMMKHVLESQIADFESKLKDEQTALAIGTKKQNIAEGQSRLKDMELAALQQDYGSMTARCHTNYETMESEDCGMKKIRGELYLMQGQDNPAFFQDCVVAEWRPDECSASCGGGVMHMTRTVVTKPIGGAQCPVLHAMKPCNEHKCPVDCKLRDWEGWSSCSAKCGGGLMQRERRIEFEPIHGGEPCGETSEAEACNLGSCDKDCELSDWTAWSECSKECDTGITSRDRAMAVPPLGGGHCPEIRGPERHEERICNSFACVKNNPSETLQCESALDVVLILDGSGSLGQTGWDATLKGGAMLARAFGGEHASVRLSVILFSYVTEFITHFTTDIEGAAVKIENLAWPRSITKTADALNAARSELALGRDNAMAVVIVVTDGRPMSLRKTRRASRELRRQARLMWVPVTKFAPLDRMKAWASYPKEENFMPMSTFADLEDPDNINIIIADLCKRVD